MTMMTKLLVLFLVGILHTVAPDAAASSNADAFAWAGIFQLAAQDGPYTLTVQMPQDGNVVDAARAHNHRDLAARALWRHLEEDHPEEDDHSGHDHETEFYFRMALVPVQTSGQAGIDEAIQLLEEENADEHDDDHFPDDDHFLTQEGKEEEDHSDHDHTRQLLSDSIVGVENGDTIAPSVTIIYELFFESQTALSAFSIEIDDDNNNTATTPQHFVLFFPAAPSQVETNQTHYLKDAQGHTIWPETIRVLSSSLANEEQEESHPNKPWGAVVGATLLVNTITLIGVIFLAPIMTKAYQNQTFFQLLKDMYSSTKVDIVPFRDPRRHDLFNMALTSFACGALLATAVFLIVPEALILINAGDEGEEDDHSGHDHRLLQEDEGEHEGHDHGNKTWVFGTCVLAGFLFPWVVSSFFPHHHDAEHEYTPASTSAADTTGGGLNNKTATNRAVSGQCEACDENVCHEIDVDDFMVQEVLPAGNNAATGSIQDEADEKEIPATKDDLLSESTDSLSDAGSFQPAINKRLVSAIILGDALHNFSDGVFVGVGFLLCDNALAWSILASTIYHELAQELSDFFLLTQHCHLPPLIALVRVCHSYNNVFSPDRFAPFVGSDPRLTLRFHSSHYVSVSQFLKWPFRHVGWTHCAGHGCIQLYHWYPSQHVVWSLHSHFCQRVHADCG